jgi:hypothetical protein
MICAMCGKPSTNVTARGRDILCHRCDAAVGVIEDMDIIDLALDYLEKNRAAPHGSVGR